MDNSNEVNPTKKRKASDGRAAPADAHDVNAGSNNKDSGFLSSWFGYLSGRGDASISGATRDENKTSQLDRMEEMMMRMEEKLSSVNNLESRCERLEEKCSSLENLLESKFDTLSSDLDQKCDMLANRLEAKVDSARAQETGKALKRHEYNEMLIKNQRWEYSVPVLSMNELIYNGYTEDEAEAEYLAEGAREIKVANTKMRRGEFDRDPSCNEKGIELAMNLNGEHPIFNYAVNNELLPHWKEFAAALKQFTPAMNLLPDNCKSFFVFDGVQLNPDAMLLIKEALIGKPFRDMSFLNNDNGDDDENLTHGGLSVDAILDIIESNKHLQELQIQKKQIGREHIQRLCSAVCTHPFVELGLNGSFDPGIGDQMLVALLSGGELKLETLDMSDNYITSAVSTILADYLATNPTLKRLVLDGNDFDDSDAALFANALRTNTTLRNLYLQLNNITDCGSDEFRLVLCDESSLNAAADSNHMCICTSFDESNRHEQWQINRGWKVYRLLSFWNITLSNVTQFGDIDVKMLPNMLEAVQKYHHAVREYNENGYLYPRPRIFCDVNPLSIVYEIMRKWDELNPL